jgi:hypothetical protein
VTRKGFRFALLILVIAFSAASTVSPITGPTGKTFALARSTLQSFSAQKGRRVELIEGWNET